MFGIWTKSGSRPRGLEISRVGDGLPGIGRETRSLRVVTIIDNGLIKIIDVRRQHRLLPEDRSVPLLAMGNGTVLLSESAEALPTA